jgi:Protein of unknown function (DUF1569)
MTEASTSVASTTKNAWRMHTETIQCHFSRRRFFMSAMGAAAAGLLAAGTSGCTDDTVNDRRLVFTSLDDALRELDRLTKSVALKRGTAWTWPQTLVHCAQSIEYSMTGFPRPKPPLFQHTIGAAAFGVFSWRERMTHDLAEQIPGAPSLDATVDAAAARARLQRAIQDFRSRKEPLRPHFAYGELNKSEYTRAHAMHLANHFSAFDVQS